MNIIDYNCFVGGWPFYKVRNNSFDALRGLHSENNIEYGYVSSTNAIFYNDPYEAELELAKTIADSKYRHVMTVNPTLPGCISDIRRAADSLKIKGVRILPGYHGYSLADEVVSEICDVLREKRLPLFLTLRLEDERVTYMFHPKSVSIDEVSGFLREITGIPVLLCNVRQRELLQLKDILLSRNDVFADCCGLKDSMTALEELEKESLIKRMVYGSLAPIFCLKSSLLIVEKSNISNEIKDGIFSGAGFETSIRAFEIT